MLFLELEREIQLLPRSEKWKLLDSIQRMLRKEEEPDQYFQPGAEYGMWSQYNAFEAAEKLQTLLEKEDAV